MSINRLGSYTLTGRPWWLTYATQTPNGIVVARAAATGLDRYPTEQDIIDGLAENQYACSPQCHGTPTTVWVDLTEGDLAALGVTPGICDWPRVVDGPRPRTNLTSNPWRM